MSGCFDSPVHYQTLLKQKEKVHLLGTILNSVLINICYSSEYSTQFLDNWLCGIEELNTSGFRSTHNTCQRNTLIVGLYLIIEFDDKRNIEYYQPFIVVVSIGSVIHHDYTDRRGLHLQKLNKSINQQNIPRQNKSFYWPHS